MGKIYLDKNNKLVVETNNGVIDGDGNTTTKIQECETYQVSVGTIQKLLTILNKQITKYEREANAYTQYYYDSSREGYCIIMSPDNLAEMLKSVEKEKYELQVKLDSARIELSKIKNDKKPQKTEFETITETCEKAQCAMGWALFFMIASIIFMIVGFVF